MKADEKMYDCLKMKTATPGRRRGAAVHSTDDPREEERTIRISSALRPVFCGSDTREEERYRCRVTDDPGRRRGSSVSLWPFGRYSLWQRRQGGGGAPLPGYRLPREEEKETRFRLSGALRRRRRNCVRDKGFRCGKCPDLPDRGCSAPTIP